MNKSEGTAEESTSVSRAVSHLAELVCLQGRLLIADLKEGAQTAKLAATLAAFSLALLLAAAPTCLIALAFFLRDQFDISLALSLLISAALAVITGAALGYAAWRAGRRGALTAIKSYDDFEKNVRSLTRS